MPDLTATRSTTLPPEEVLVRAVQFLTNERWRAQSQTNRIATFVGMARVSRTQIAVMLLLMMCGAIPGILYYFVVISKMRRLQNIVVTTTPRDTGCDVVVTYPAHAKKMVDAFIDVYLAACCIAARSAYGCNRRGITCIKAFRATSRREEVVFHC